VSPRVFMRGGQLSRCRASLRGLPLAWCDPATTGRVQALSRLPARRPCRYTNRVRSLARRLTPRPGWTAGTGWSRLAARRTPA
jgi:hypothetical protein